jgi:hypothetical protein
MSKETQNAELSKDKALHIADVISRFSSKSKIEAIAEVVYPKDKRKDIDGDWYDANTQERNGFVTGCMVILQQCGVDLNGL